ncbi:MAG TPA: hypothetical protein VGL22_15225 [Terracidiphilus sp.]
MSTAALGLWISHSAPIDGVPAAPLPYFLHGLPARALGGADDITARIGRITTAGNAADAAADDLDVAADDTAAAAAKARLDTARTTLCNELTDLRTTRFWARRHSLVLSLSAVPTQGCGLLNVLTWIYQRDASIYKVVLNLKDRLADHRRLPDLMWTLEVRSFVYPEKGPLDALVDAMVAVGIAWDAAWAGPMVDDLRSRDFWIPTGTKSLDKLRAALIPAAALADGLTALDEAGVRTQLARFNWEWATLRNMLKSTSDGLLTLQRILLFRTDLTNRLMNEAVGAVAAAERPKFTPYRRVRFSVPGSTRATSDIDVNMRGSATELVAIEFNRRFRAWTLAATTAPAVELESGYVFDVNVYAQDYTRDLGVRFMKPDVPGPDVWPTAPTPQWTEAEKSQDVYSLIKMRRYMPTIAWSDFTLGVRTVLAGGSFADRVTATAAQGDALAASVETEKRSVATLSPTMASIFPKNWTMRAENNLYGAQLRVVYSRRGYGTALDDAGKLALIQEFGKASYLAQEAYFTAGAVRDIVSNLQIGQGLTLSMYERLHSFNEQVADIFKDAGHFPAEGGTETIDFAVEASKYMARMAAAALGANYDLVTKIFEAQFAQLGSASSSSSRALPAKESYATGVDIRLNGLLDLQTILGAWQARAVNLMKIKDNPAAFKKENGDWSDTAAALLVGAPWTEERTGFSNSLLSLAVVMNVEARTDPAPTMRLGSAGDSVLFLDKQATLAEAIS